MDVYQPRIISMNSRRWKQRSVLFKSGTTVRIIFTHCGSVVNLGGVVSGCGEGGCRQKRLIRWRKMPGGCHWCEERVGGCPARPDYRTAMCKKNSYEFPRLRSRNPIGNPGTLANSLCITALAPKEA